MAEVVVRLDAGAVTKMLRSPSGPVVADLRRRGNRVLNRARQLAPVDTGVLRSSLTMNTITVGGEPAVEVGTNVFYALYVHEGTRPHVIRGNPYLHFFWPKVGRRVTFPFVNHPGTKPNPFLRRALSAAAD